MCERQWSITRWGDIRVCPGKLLGENSVFLIITSILYCCHISLPTTANEYSQEKKIKIGFTTGLVR